jgi:hypothetical protein
VVLDLRRSHFPVSPLAVPIRHVSSQKSNTLVVVIRGFS